MRWENLCGISTRFRVLSPSYGQVPHVLLTRSPLRLFLQAGRFGVRLACIRHAASVRPEPRSNSRFKRVQVNTCSILVHCCHKFSKTYQKYLNCLALQKVKLETLALFGIIVCSVFKDLFRRLNATSYIVSWPFWSCQEEIWVSLLNKLTLLLYSKQLIYKSQC